MLAGFGIAVHADGEGRHPLQLRDCARPRERDVLVPPASARPIRRASFERPLRIDADRQLLGLLVPQVPDHGVTRRAGRMPGSGSAARGAGGGARRRQSRWTVEGSIPGSQGHSSLEAEERTGETKVSSDRIPSAAGSERSLRARRVRRADGCTKKSLRQARGRRFRQRRFGVYRWSRSPGAVLAQAGSRRSVGLHRFWPGASPSHCPARKDRGVASRQHRRRRHLPAPAGDHRSKAEAARVRSPGARWSSHPG